MHARAHAHRWQRSHVDSVRELSLVEAAEGGSLSISSFSDDSLHSAGTGACIVGNSQWRREACSSRGCSRTKDLPSDDRSRSSRRALANTLLTDVVVRPALCARPFALRPFPSSSPSHASVTGKANGCRVGTQRQNDASSLTFGRQECRWLSTRNRNRVIAHTPKSNQHPPAERSALRIRLPPSARSRAHARKYRRAHADTRVRRNRIG